jgi:ABC-type proline/glycine betaine transport system permease subunit
MSALAALAAVGSGVVKSSIGYHWLANSATVAAIAIVIAAIAVDRSRRLPAEIGVSG